MTYGPPASSELLRRRPLRLLAAPVRERRFTYGEYARFLDGLDLEHVRPLRELRHAPAGVGLRHDVDDRLDSALAFARLEAARGLRATYFLLHTAPYWPDGRFRELQELGHEVGLHNDAVTVHARTGADPVAELARALETLRAQGLDVVGVAAHGSREARERRFLNHLLFSDLPERAPRFPNNDVTGELLPPPGMPRTTLAALGLLYDADFLDHDAYFADSYVDVCGRRWHPGDYRPGTKTVVLTHPCLWDGSRAAKAARTVGRALRGSRRR
ncbi:MAG: hypothetical protein ABR521_10920 [Gaiellaceae bacterium]